MFKVEDLRTGMKVVTEDNEYIVLLGCNHGYDSRTNIAVNPRAQSYSWNADLDNVLEEALEIFIPEHPYDVFYNHNGWVSIWKKEPKKTEVQLKMDELQATIEKAQRELQELKGMK